MNWFMYVEEKINPDTVRKIAKLNDEAIKLVMASWLVDIAGGIKLPTEHKAIIAKRLILKNKQKETIKKISGISERHYWRLKKELKDER